MLNITEIYDVFAQGRVVTTDSRNVPRHSIFFALKGDNFDGNKYAAKALEAGADFAIVDDMGILSEFPKFAERFMLVDDVLACLQALAKEHRRRLNISIVALTGSNGKTTTKELLYEALSAKYNVAATKGNLNNHIGVPLTLLSFDASHKIGIVEMGASAVGEIALLCEIAEPNYGLISNIGRAHLEGFGGEEGIKRGKGELFDYLAVHGGVAFVSSDDAVLCEIAEQREGLQIEKFSYSLADEIKHNLEGEYNRRNIAAALAVGSYLGVSEPLMQRKIAAYEPTNQRSQRAESANNTLIIDCYNANPSSMEAAIENMRKGDFEGKAKVLILGEMLELGEWSGKEHLHIAKLAVKAAAQGVLFVGEGFREAAERLGARWFLNRSQLAQALEEQPFKACVILIKGSRGVGLEKIIDLL